MKKIVLVCVGIYALAGIYSCKETRVVTAAVAKPFTSVKTYENTAVGLWVKPVNIDTAKVKANKTYLIEGNMPTDGEPVLVFVKGDILLEVMKLNLSTSLLNLTFGSKVEGILFTANDLGRKSLFTYDQINESTAFDQQQKETLLRDKSKRKFELRSFLPIKA